MIPVVNPIPDPEGFDTECRTPGIVWRATRRLQDATPKTSEFPNLWAKYGDYLGQAFHGRCGWWAMWIAEGQVDHFLSKKNRPDLTYEWSNYRYIAGSVNGSKGNHDDKILDPFEVLDGWFEVILPSMQLILTDQIPKTLIAKAEFTLTELHLHDGKKVVRCRKRWYDQFKGEMLTFDGLQLNAPLVAKAVKKLQDSGEPLP